MDTGFNWLDYTVLIGYVFADHDTLQFVRREAWFVGIRDLKAYSGWVKPGGKAIDGRLMEEADEILATRNTEPIPTDALKRMDEVLKKL